MAYTRLCGGRLFIYHPLELVIVKIDYIAIVINVPVLILIVFPFLLTAELRKCFFLLDAANAAEEMPCRLGMKLVLGERRFSGKEPELALVHLDHERVLAPADRTITHGEFWEVGLDLEPNGAAMATSLVALIRATTHDVESPMWGRCA